MKENSFSNHALCASLVLGGLLTLSSPHTANNEVKDNNNVVAVAPIANPKIVGTWELTNKDSYAIVRNPRTHKEYKVGFTIDRYDDYKFLPINFATGEPVNLRTLVGHDDNDLDDKLHRFGFYHDGAMSIIEREDSGRRKRDDDIGVYGFHRDGFFVGIGDKMYKNLQIRFLNDNEFELTRIKFNDSDLGKVIAKKAMRYVRVTRK